MAQASGVEPERLSSRFWNPLVSPITAPTFWWATQELNLLPQCPPSYLRRRIYSPVKGKLPRSLERDFFTVGQSNAHIKLTTDSFDKSLQLFQ